MLAQKTDNKKNLILIGVFIAVLLAVLFTLFKDKLFASKSGAESGQPDPLFTEIKLEPAKRDDYGLFKDPEFSGLKDSNVSPKPVDSLQVGNPAPFSAK